MTAEMRMTVPYEKIWIEPLANFLVNEATMSKFRQYLRIIQLYLTRQLIDQFRYLFTFSKMALMKNYVGVQSLV